MSLIAKQTTLESLSFTLFELTGQKLYELYEFIVRNPVIARFIRQNITNRRVGTIRLRTRDAAAIVIPRSLRRSQPMIIEDDDEYELPIDVPYIPVEENTTAAAEKAKLESLEAELARLRAEMAQFMQAAAVNMHLPNATVTPQYVVASEEPSGAELAVTPAAGLHSVVPPPPPHPKASSLITKSAKSEITANDTTTHQSTLNSTTYQYSSLTSGAVHSSANSTTTSNASNTPDIAQKSTSSLSDMVKASSRNSLRKVEGERSPGGTVKRAPTRRADPTNPSDILAQALKKRFQSVSGSPMQSPDTKSSQSRIGDEFDD